VSRVTSGDRFEAAIVYFQREEQIHLDSEHKINDL